MDQTKIDISRRFDDWALTRETGSPNDSPPTLFPERAIRGVRSHRRSSQRGPARPNADVVSATIVAAVNRADRDREIRRLSLKVSDLQARIQKFMSSKTKFKELLDSRIQTDSGWNGSNSKPSTALAYASAIEVLELVLTFCVRDNKLVTHPAVVPLKAGGFQIEWDGAKEVIEIEIADNGQMAILTSDEHGQTIFEMDNATIAEVVTAVTEVLRS